MVVLFLYLISCSMMLFNVVLETMRSYCLLHISESEFVCISIIFIHAVSTCVPQVSWEPKKIKNQCHPPSRNKALLSQGTIPHWFPLIRPYYMTRACIGGMTLGLSSNVFWKILPTESCQSVDYFVPDYLLDPFGTNGVMKYHWHLESFNEWLYTDLSKRWLLAVW